MASNDLDLVKQMRLTCAMQQWLYTSDSDMLEHFSTNRQK